MSRPTPSPLFAPHLAVLIPALLLASWLAVGASAQVPPPALPEAIAGKLVRHPDLTIADRLDPVSALDRSRAASAEGRLAQLGVAPETARVDRRSGRWATLLPSTSLLAREDGASAPSGWEVVPRSGRTPSPPSSSVEEAAWQALRLWLEEHREALRIELDQLGEPRVTVHDGGERIQLWVPRRIDGVPVRDAALTAVINHGNLVLFGLQRWGDVDAPRRPTLAADAAVATLAAHLAPLEIETLGREPELVLVPTARERDVGRVRFGDGYRYRLVWVLRPVLSSAGGGWEALVDATSGELLLFDDSRHYSTPREVVGGVLPLSNDGALPGGIEQPRYPMPFADVLAGGAELFTDAGGNLPICVDGPITTSLDGRYVRIEDACGAVSETRDGSLDLGTGGDLECVVPLGSTSPGNTQAARTAFYEVNRAAEIARGHLPGNPWLADQLTAVVNIPDFGFPEFNCNAFWDETTINFFTSGDVGAGLSCTNTGELTGVITHEWGHGLDDNDANPTISNPGEGIADVYAALRLNQSCIGRGFYTGVNNCGSDDNDPCLDCDGVRDIDWAKRTSGQPHDLAWIDAQCPAVLFGTPGPCGGSIHCEGAVYAEAIWDLVHRDLPALYGHDLDTALEIGTRLTYLGAGFVGQWYTCSADGTGSGDGCNADGGYLNFLAVDDDNGDLGDGTPHMAAIHAAFDRHGIACAAPAVQDSGCGPAWPLAAPALTVTPTDRGALLEWTSVPGAAGYRVLRTDGAFGCDFGKAKVGETAGTSWLDEGLLNGHPYSWVVLPVAASDSCLGPASNCAAALPLAGPNLGFDPTSITVDLLNGDLDGVIDNCEQGVVSFALSNIGSGELTGVEITDVEVLSHPGSVVVTTPLPIALGGALPGCGSAQASFAFTASGLAFDDELVFRVRATGDQLAGRERSELIRLPAAETSLLPSATHRFDFESGRDGFETVYGTFDRTDANGGADGSSFYLASSSSLPEQCDVVRSPIFRLTPSSRLTLSTRYDVEPSFELEGSVFWFDRANAGLFDVHSGKRQAIEPDGGRPYEAHGPYGSCETQGQAGWAGSQSAWGASSFTASALGAKERAGRFLQLDLRYGTDVDVHGTGFHFDEVVLENVERVIADAQADLCVAGNAPPLPGDDFAVVADTEAVSIAVLANDGDPDPGDALRVAGITQPALGEVTIEPLGPGLDRVVYRPTEGPGGADVFRYSASDGRGGSAIADVTVDRQFLFFADFETRGLDAWDGVTGVCDPDGTFTVDDPDAVQYQCCLGLVSVDVDQFVFSADGATVVPGPVFPADLGSLDGTATSCPAGSFTAVGVLEGGCRETYTLDGDFTGPDSWQGTFSIQFVGPDCSCDFFNDPCVDQLFPITATR